MKTEEATKRLERMEREGKEEDDAENEVNLEQTPENKMIVDKLFVDRCGWALQSTHSKPWVT